MYFAFRRRQAAVPVFRRRCWSLGNPGREVPPGSRHGAPAAWLGAKGTYLICPMTLRRYLACVFVKVRKTELRKAERGGTLYVFISLS